MLVRFWINFTSIDPIEALVYAAVINGIVAVPILIAIMRIANDRKILKNRITGRISNILGWTTVMIMGISVVIMFTTWDKH